MAIYTNSNEFTPQISTGEKIKKYRLNNNLSQVDVARMMKKSPVWLSKIETDQREIKVNDLVKICKIFQIDISELLGINKNNSGYKTVLQNVLSNLPNEIPVYRTQELDKLFITKEPPLPLIKLVASPNLKLGAPISTELPLMLTFCALSSNPLPTFLIYSVSLF